MEENNLFDQATNPSQTPSEVESFLDKYVGEGKRYRTPEDLAKAKAHADTHIDTLTSEMKTLRELMATQFEQMSKRQEGIPPPANQPNEIGEVRNIAPQPTPKESQNEEDLDARIQKLLEQKTLAERVQENARLTETVLIEHLGSKEAAVEAIRTKAEELGVGPQFLADTAFSSPKAFFRMMGVDPDTRPRSNNTPSPASDVNPRALGNMNTSVKPGTYAHYSELRRTNPKVYNSMETQSKMMRDALALGQDFYK